jgi:hypothetical protein
MQLEWRNKSDVLMGKYLRRREEKIKIKLRLILETCFDGENNSYQRPLTYIMRDLFHFCDSVPNDQVI